MTDHKDRKPLGKRLRDDSTLKDAVLTGTLASRVKREVAVEKASATVSETAEAHEDQPEERVVVVLGPDGVPQIADAVDAAPETVRVDLEDAPRTKKPPPLPTRKA